MRKYLKTLLSICLAVCLTAGLAADKRQESQSSDVQAFLSWNKSFKAARCNDESSALVVVLKGKKYCVRYFASDGVQDAENVLFVVPGDRDKANRMSPKKIKNNTLSAQRKKANRRAKKYGIPVITLARMGTYGSSGNHRKKRHIEEYQLINAAITQLKNKYHFKNMTFYGHSGGATIGAGLLTMGRDDIACYVLTSGAYDLVARNRWFRQIRGKKDNGRAKNRYDPLQHVDSIPAQANTRVYLLGNRRDRQTGYQFQEKMYHAFKRVGINTELLEVPTFAPNYHNLKYSAGFRCAQLCTAHPARSCRELLNKKPFK